VGKVKVNLIFTPWSHEKEKTPVFCPGQQVVRLVVQDENKEIKSPLK
jgi:hypothetical protein